MINDCGSISGPPELDKFADICAKKLFSHEPYKFHYPRSCSLQNWQVKEIKKLNIDFLKTLRNRANVYAIFIRKGRVNSSWKKMYVGQRKSKGLRGRITEHLIKKDCSTGAMLERIKKAVSEGFEIGISYIKVNPESLRLYVEEMIIIKYAHELEWNTHK